MGAPQATVDAKAGLLVVSDEVQLAQTVARLTGPAGTQARYVAQIADRLVEYDALVELLLAGRTPGVNKASALPLAEAVAAGCLGDQHLWRDLDLPERSVLRALLETFFEPLAADNYMDMRWKKFIYRRLCRWGGFNSCPAPSCAACTSYSECFGSEM